MRVEDAALNDRPTLTPMIVHLSGRRRGTTERLRGDTLRIGTTSDAEIRLPADELPPGPEVVATLERRGASYELSAAPGVDTWVNGERVEQISLASGDVVEVGKGGPVLRFRLREGDVRPYKSVMEAFSDCYDCARYGADTTASKASIFTFAAARELATQTSPLMRALLGTIAVLVVAFLGTLVYRTLTLEQQIAESEIRVQELEKLLEGSEGNSFSADDFTAARAELDRRLGESIARIEELETRSVARERVIAAATPSVVFLQGGYGFVDPVSGRRLRFAVSPARGRRADPAREPGTSGETPPGETDGGAPSATGEPDPGDADGAAPRATGEPDSAEADGAAQSATAGTEAGNEAGAGDTSRADNEARVLPSSMFTLDGDGPVVEVFFTGTGFVATDRGHIVTNRHVAVPWEFDEAAKRVISSGLMPVMTRFLAYFAGREQPIDVQLVKASDAGDVALLSAPTADLAALEATPLELSAEPPRVGDELIVLGYPAGINALLARADPAYIEGALSGGTVDFWEMAAVLAKGGYVSPLATVGIAGQVTTTSIVYDAETTHGGSGGPVLDLDGRVVAVNSAVMPQFGGSNLGVPAIVALELLDAQ